MNESHVDAAARELSLRPQQVRAAALLFEQGATIPFVARYRKEATGSMDEVALAAVRDRLGQLGALDERRGAILASLRERGALTPELEASLSGASTLAALEDLYLPFRPKRRTRASMAREKGLEPLARWLLLQEPGNPDARALAFVDEARGAATVEEALAGARDIVAERVSEDAATRGILRDLFWSRGVVASVVAPGKEEEGAKYRDYFAWREPLAPVPSHRMLAMRRGEKEGFLRLTVAPPEEAALALVEARWVRGDSAASAHVRDAVRDGYRRLLSLSLETEVRLEAKKRADAGAIAVFARNLREMLLAAPLGERPVLAVDPGYRTGCKVVALGAQGLLLEHAVVFPGFAGGRPEEAEAALKGLCRRHGPAAIAVGNGTGGRETEAFLRGLDLPGHPHVVMVNESGASIYSASEAAREEFPGEDVTVRGAVSIGRRLQDPLSELVKIDPKSIGVGQYQHDVDQKALRQALDEVVASCVNAVGVELNTASRQLLAYVSGLGPSLAAAVVAHREAHGPFASRRALLEVPRLGPKAFEQAAGFLRVRNSGNPLDASAVHPESYGLVERMAGDLHCTVADLMADASLRARVEPGRYVTESVGLPTLTDILAELDRPGRDPRERFEPFAFAEGVEKMEDLRPGMVLPGIVTNVAAFGAFVDVGVHQDGLVHVSRLANRYVKNPSEVVKVQQRVTVTVVEVDLRRRRISLSMRDRG